MSRNSVDDRSRDARLKEIRVSLENDNSISEIDILPDGRVCLFGASRQVLEVLDAIPLGDPALRGRIERLRTPDGQQAAEPGEACSAQNAKTMEASNGTVTP
jgi:hypothetical protein